MTQALITRKQDYLLRGLAILAVLGIHFLSAMKKSPYVSSASLQILGVGIDQLFRFGVPMFVALSGYGLAIKYGEHVFYWRRFVKSRFRKLLPGYVLWSGILALSFWVVPVWSGSRPEYHFFWQLFLGRADYHLYFVPMILQLYFLFPLLFYAFKRHPKGVLFGAFAVQAFWYWQFIYHENILVQSLFSLHDKEQYVWATNWIGYFVLGMYLPTLWTSFKNSKVLAWLFSLGTLVGLVFVVWQALTAINSGTDPLDALRFTRYVMMIYCSGAIIVGSWWVQFVVKPSNMLVWLGRHSYVIYLSHTLFLRLLFLV